MNNISESDGKNDYRYYQIDYPTAVLSTVLTISSHPDNNWVTWIVSIDKSKFLTGIGLDWRGVDYIDLNIVSAGF